MNVASKWPTAARQNTEFVGEGGGGNSFPTKADHTENIVSGEKRLSQLQKDQILVVWQTNKTTYFKIFWTKVKILILLTK